MTDDGLRKRYECMKADVMAMSKSLDSYRDMENALRNERDSLNQYIDAALTVSTFYEADKVTQNHADHVNAIRQSLGALPIVIPSARDSEPCEGTEDEVRTVEVELYEKRIVNSIPAREVAKAVIRNRRTEVTTGDE